MKANSRKVDKSPICLTLLPPKDSASKTQTGDLIWEDPNNPSSVAELMIESFQIICGTRPALVGMWKREHCQSFWDVVLHPIGQIRSRFGILLDDFGKISFISIPVGCIEDHPKIGSHFSLHGLSGYVSTGILLQVKLAALSGYTDKKGDLSGQ